MSAVSQDRISDNVAEALFSARAALGSASHVLNADHWHGDRHEPAMRCYAQAQAEALIACAEALDGIRRALDDGVVGVRDVDKI